MILNVLRCFSVNKKQMKLNVKSFIKDFFFLLLYFIIVACKQLRIYCMCSRKPR